MAYLGQFAGRVVLSDFQPSMILPRPSMTSMRWMIPHKDVFGDEKKSWQLKAIAGGHVLVAEKIKLTFGLIYYGDESSLLC